jgi:hypothetical protein
VLQKEMQRSACVALFTFMVPDPVFAQKTCDRFYRLIHKYKSANITAYKTAEGLWRKRKGISFFSSQPLMIADSIFEDPRYLLCCSIHRAASVPVFPDHKFHRAMVRTIDLRMDPALKSWSFRHSDTQK